MKAKTGIRILFYSGAMAILIPHYWDRICFGICFAKGSLDAGFNLLAHRKIIFTYGPRVDYLARGGMASSGMIRHGPSTR